MNEMAMPEGVIGGGWTYVIAGYAITAIVLAAYAWILRRRLRRTENAEDER